MKLAYIIGPYRASNAWEAEKNIRRAEELALEKWLEGFAVICPHTNTRFFQGAADDKVWLEGDLEILSRCDVAFVVPCTAEEFFESDGSVEEVRRAFELDIPVYKDNSLITKYELENKLMD